MPDNNWANTMPSLLNPADDGLDYTAEEKTQLRAIIKQNNAYRRTRPCMRVRFRGRPQTGMRSQTMKKSIVYKECISEQWASMSEENQAVLDSAPSVPESFTIWKAEIPDDFISEDDLRMLDQDD